MPEWMLTEKEIIEARNSGDMWKYSTWDMVAQFQARKIVGSIKKHIEDNGGRLDMIWFMRLCKEVGL